MHFPMFSPVRGQRLHWPWPVILVCAVLVVSVPQAQAADDGYSFSVLHVFKKKFDGKRYPTELNAIAIGADGRLVGTSGSDMGSRHGTAYSLAAEGGEAQLLHRFGTEREHLYSPSGPVVPQADGSVIGAASSSGRGTSEGAIFRLNATGSLQVLHLFAGAPGDGASPTAAPTLGRDGWWYGPTYRGGRHDKGSLYRMGPAGQFELLYSFHGKGHGDGQFPFEGLTEGPDGRFYGVTDTGGAHDLGTLFRIGPDGVYERLHDFRNGALGTRPRGRLCLAADGQLYGMTSTGGRWKEGTLFRVRPNGRPETLHDLLRTVDGISLGGGFSLGPDGGLYYPMRVGVGEEVDAIFRLDPATGQVKKVATQPKGGNDGAYYTLGPLAIATDGSLFATTQAYGSSGIGGTVIRFTPLPPARAAASLNH